MKAQADVTPIEFGSLDKALSAIHRIRRDANEQEASFEQVQMTVHRGLGQGNVARRFGLIDELAEPKARRAQQAAEIRQSGDGRERLDVALIGHLKFLRFLLTGRIGDGLSQTRLLTQLPGVRGEVVPKPCQPTVMKT
jgi:hypothetical protein